MTEGVSRPIVLRLGLAFLSVAVLGVLLAGVLAVLIGREDFSALEQKRRDALIASIIAVASSTYNTGAPGWSDVDVQPALTLAAQSDARMAVIDNEGQTVVTDLSAAQNPADVVTRPILLKGNRIGTLQLTFTGRSLFTSLDDLRDALTSAVIGAAGIASLAALVMSLLVAGRLSHPLARLTEAARSMTSGDRRARVGPMVGAPSEIMEVAAALDEMAESLAREQQRRDEQFADITHELRRPIAVLLAMSEAMTDGYLPLDREHANSLHEEVLQLAALVGDLPSVAAARTAVRNTHRQVCDLAEIATVLCQSWESRFTAAKLRFTHELQSALINADPGRMRQVMANLLANALQYTPSGGDVRVSLRTDGGWAHLEVADTGVGIDPLDQPHLFERLWRSASVGQTEGTGIGLAVANEYTQANGGRIEVQSVLGEGSRFTVIIPLVE